MYLCIYHWSIDWLIGWLWSESESRKYLRKNIYWEFREFSPTHKPVAAHTYPWPHTHIPVAHTHTYPWHTHTHTRGHTHTHSGKRPHTPMRTSTHSHTPVQTLTQHAHNTSRIRTQLAHNTHTTHYHPTVCTNLYSQKQKVFWPVAMRSIFRLAFPSKFESNLRIHRPPPIRQFIKG